MREVQYSNEKKKTEHPKPPDTYFLHCLMYLHAVSVRVYLFGITDGIGRNFRFRLQPLATDHNI